MICLNAMFGWGKIGLKDVVHQSSIIHLCFQKVFLCLAYSLRSAHVLTIVWSLAAVHEIKIV